MNSSAMKVLGVLRMCFEKLFHFRGKTVHIFGVLPVFLTAVCLRSSLVASLWYFLKDLVIEPEPQQVCFSNSNFKTLPSDRKIEEEAHDISRYYPVQIGDVINDQYQIVGKLGYGIGSTVWLANSLR